MLGRALGCKNFAASAVFFKSIVNAVGVSVVLLLEAGLMKEGFGFGFGSVNETSVWRGGRVKRQIVCK